MLCGDFESIEKSDSVSSYEWSRKFNCSEAERVKLYVLAFFFLYRSSPRLNS